jgi:prepilin-type N-terminal cleavage/methylation domain-containing protein
MGKKRGFTLIELMVVITIIALLLTILLPGLAKALKLARVTRCAANMDSISDSMATMDAEVVQYGSGGSGRLIWTNYTRADTVHLATGASASARATNPWGSAPLAEYPVTTNMYALIHKADVEPGLFICPNTLDEVDENIIDEDNQRYWDFVNNSRVSYSFQAPIRDGADDVTPFVSAHDTVVVMADENPIGQVGVGGNGQPQDEVGAQIDWETWSETNEKPNIGSGVAVSANHEGEHINALKHDGTVRSSYRANIGFNRDCIYTPGGDTNTSGADAWENSTYTGTVDLEAGTGYDITDHVKANDSFLIDTPENAANPQ